MTFIDHNAGIVANGSVLGKEFSANVFNDLYPAPKEECQVAEQRYPERKLDPQSHTTNPLTEAADTLLDLADTKAYEEQQRIIQRRKTKTASITYCLSYKSLKLKQVCRFETYSTEDV